MDRKIIFSHKRALGDCLMFTAGIRDFKLLFPDIKINVDSNQPDLWKNNPYIDTSLKRCEGVEFYKVGYPMVGNVNNTAMHFTSMFLFDMIAAADLTKSLEFPLGEFCAAFANGSVGDPPMGDITKHENIAKEPFISLRKKYKNLCENFMRQRGDIHLSDKEKENNIIKSIYGIEKYWVIAPGGKRDATSKIWDWRKFQEVIDYFEGKIKFVTIGKSDLLLEKLHNTIDLTDKFNTDIRGTMSLVYHADGCVSGPSYLMHLAAAIPPRFEKERKPCVTIFGGREPSSWSWYCNQQILHTNGIFKCCDNGGCWKSRTYPLPKDIEHNKNLCTNTIKRDGRTIQKCMDVISSQDVIRAIEKYYEGNIYKYEKTRFKRQVKKEEINIPSVNHSTNSKEINLLGNLNTSGGGEQSLIKIASCLKNRGWKVNLHPWSTVHQNYNGVDVKSSFKSGMNDMVEQIPLLFYANDCIWDFVKCSQKIVEKSSSVIIGINFANGDLPSASWLAKSKKLKAIVFQNQEKRNEFEKQAIGFDDTKLIVMYGAINLNKFIETCPKKREKNEPFVILKHCVPDYRKYVTSESYNKGDKIHVWQKHMDKELDTKFYKRLLKDTKNTRFEFMEAHKELINAFKDEPRMVFHKWDSMSVSSFLSRGHAYLYRTSNLWRDQYPRVVAEALAVGLPILTEPRDGTKDRVDFGNTGFYCIDYDGFLYAINLLKRKEEYRYHICRNAKDWAKQNLDPDKWVDMIEETINGG